MSDWLEYDEKRPWPGETIPKIMPSPADARGVAPAPPEEDAIRARWEKATAGPWEAPFTSYVLSRNRNSHHKICQLNDPWIHNPNEAADSEAIANAPTDIAWLLSALSAAQAEVADLRQLYGAAVMQMQRAGIAVADLPEPGFDTLLNPIEQASLEMKLRVSLWMVYHKLDKEGSWALTTARRQRISKS